jgi:hypothetical protein
MMKNRTKREETMKNAGINTGKYFSIQLPEGLKPGSTVSIIINENGEAVLSNDNSVHKHDFDDIENQIFANGYVKNTKLHRRWVMAQMFRMLNYERNQFDKGYDACLRNCYPYQYQFKMMLEEVRVLSKLECSDKQAYEERSHFFDQYVIIKTCNDYLEKLRRYIAGLKIRHCKGIEYVRISGKDIFISDLNNKVYMPLENMIRNIKYSINYNALYCNLRRFINKMIKLPDNTPKCKEWIDAYKGAGSYYTLMNMVKFHNCFIINQYTGEVLRGCDSVKYLEDMLYLYHDQYWRMFALLKQTIKDNNFDFYKRMSEI